MMRFECRCPQCGALIDNINDLVVSDINPPRHITCDDGEVIPILPADDDEFWSLVLELKAEDKLTYDPF